MFLRFGVSNYRSIREYAEVSFIAAGAIKDQGPKLLNWDGGKVSVLPAIVVYGANAAGKSSVHMAMGAMRSNVINSFRNLDATGDIPRQPFALDGASKDLPTRFDCDFIIDGVRFHYGYEYNDQVFLREWLFSFPEGYKRLLFNRDHESDDIEFGKHLRGKNKAIEDLTRPNSLFLSAAAQGAHEQLTKVYRFFSSKITGLGAALNDTSVQRRIGKNPDRRLIPFLKFADTGISDIKVSDEEQTEEYRRTFMALRATLMSELGEEGIPRGLAEMPTPQTEVSFYHGGEAGEGYQLPFSKESRGTKRVASIVVAAFDALDRGATFFIDEIDASLHTLLSLKVLSLFLNEETNPNGAQIVATTHDTNILCSGLLRRDQVWFAEKDSSGATNVYPLTDIKTRNTDNLEKGYLQGRFGAVPYFGDVEELFGAN